MSFVYDVMWKNKQLSFSLSGYYRVCRWFYTNERLLWWFFEWRNSYV